MHRRILALALVALSACATAKNGPQTTNPPLTEEQKKVLLPPVPPEKDYFMDGAEVVFPKFGFRMTLADAAWQGKVEKQKDGSKRVVIFRSDLKSVLQIAPTILQKVTAAQIAESHREDAIQEGFVPTPVVNETPERLAFMVESPKNVPPTKSYFCIFPIPGMSDGYLIVLATTDMAHADAYFDQVRTLIGTIKAYEEPVQKKK